MTDWGQNLRQARLNKGLTQEQAAHKAGIHTQTWAQWERGIKSPTLTLATQAVAILGGSINIYWPEAR